MKTNQIEPPVSNRKFGFFFTLVFAIITAYFYDESFNFTVAIFTSLTLITLVTTVFIPNMLLLLNRAWMRLGFLLGKIVSPIITAIIFFVLITPIAVITRAFGRDELHLKRYNKDSYWEDRKPTTIEPLSFKNQF